MSQSFQEVATRPKERLRGSSISELTKAILRTVGNGGSVRITSPVSIAGLHAGAGQTLKRRGLQLRTHKEVDGSISAWAEKRTA